MQRGFFYSLMVLFSAVWTLSLASPIGCGDSGNNENTGLNENENDNINNNANENTNENGNTNANGNNNDNGNTNENGNGNIGPYETCSEFSAEECFSNYDCEESERCQDVGPDGYEVPCCVTGERGTLSAGESCEGSGGELLCASGICVSRNEDTSLCSDRCNTEDDCPEGMKNCMYIAFSGSDDKWCMPE